MSSFKLPIDEWGENTLVQGLNYDQNTDTYIGHRADNDAGQAKQDVEFIMTDARGNKLGKINVENGGHGSSTGMYIDTDGIYEMWFGHDKLARSGYVRFKRNESGTKTFTKTDLPEGDIEIDQANNRLILRNGNRYRVYELDTVRRNSANNRVKLADFTLPAWGLRWQGMYITEGRLLIHRDVKTKGASRVHMYDLTGKPVSFPASSLTGNKAQNWIDSTNMGDEAEGFMSKSKGDKVEIYVIKRTGPTGTKRVIEGTLILSLPKLKTPWDGKFFPGADAFDVGSRHPAVVILGKRLEAHGWTGYKSGPGIPMSETDKAGVRWFQEKQGWTGTGADGVPGPQTWARLLDAPKPTEPTPDPEPEKEEHQVIQIVSRAQWGAKPWAGQPASVSMSKKYHFLTHYHGGPVSDQYGIEVPKLVESIHRANGWSGPGYNFMIDMAGVIYEGRGWGLVGAHCPGRNTDGLGVYVAVGGDQKPSNAALRSLRALYSEACRRAGRTLEKCYHSKHYATSCPGDYLRDWVNDGMPAPTESDFPPVVVDPPKPPVVIPPVVVDPPKPPVVIEPMKFPGAAAFVIGSPHPAVAILGQRLVAHGWKYKVGPGIPMGTADVKGTQWFQGLQGWDGTGADGVPGKLTWEALLKEPTKRLTPPPNGAPIFGRVTTGFKAKGGWVWSQGHPGEDWNGEGDDFGDAVFAVRSGIVKYIGRLPWDQKSGNSFGDRALVIQDDVGTYQTLYAHMSSVNVRLGQRVQVGDKVGAMGFSGNVIPANRQGTHLHVERRKAPYRYGTDVVKPVYGD